MTSDSPGSTRHGLLGDPDRLAALAATGLDASGHPELDRFAGMAVKLLGVPVALVSLVDADRQYFPGAVGLGAPWDERRQTPLSHSFCQFVVATEEPMVIDDARTDARVCDNPAVDDLRVAAYAGMPLTDDDGRVLGSLCAIDHEPHAWTGRELELLADLAAACSAVLRMRLAVDRAGHANAARDQAQATAQLLAAEVRTALDRSEILLAASRELGGTNTINDVLRAVSRLISGGLAPVQVSLSVVESDGGRTRLVAAAPTIDPTDGEPEPLEVAGMPATAELPIEQPLFVSDRAAMETGAAMLRTEMDRLGWRAMASVPLRGPNGVEGTLTFGWSRPHNLDVGEQAVILALAGYVARALERATYLRSRISAAETLQRALLTPMPAIPGLELTARYLPASDNEQVGGDWYDAVRIGNDVLALVIGDVTGHDMAAAAAMSELRSMLRGYLVDRNESPSAILHRLEQANFNLGARTMATAVVCFVERTAAGTIRLRWSNAGHPPPILIRPDGHVHTLSSANHLIGASLRLPRTDSTELLPPGATLLLHTDGLIESRTVDWPEMTAKLHAILNDHVAAPLDALVDAVIAQLPTAGKEDDVAVLALRDTAAAVLPGPFSGPGGSDL